MRPTGTESNYMVRSGSDLVITHGVVDDQEQVVDLTGATCRALVKSDPGQADEQAVASFEVSLTAPAEGLMRLLLPDSETSKLAPGRKYYYDLHVTLPADHPDYPGLDEVPLFGVLEIIPMITQATG